MPKRRRSNGEGTIYQNNGKWIAQISYWKDGELKRPKRTCAKHADAVAKLDELRKEARQLDMDEQHHTVESYLIDYLKDIKNGGHATKTFKCYDNVIRPHIIPQIGKLKLSKLKPAKVRAMLTSLRENGVGSRQVQLAYVVLKTAMGRAVADEIIMRNPCDPVTKPPHTKRKVIPFTKEERDAIFEQGKDSFHLPMYKFILSTGMRSSEVFGIEWDDIDYETKTININKQFINGETSKLKTKGSNRILDLTPGIEKILEAQKAKLKSKGHQDNEFIFCGVRGGRINSDKHGTRFWNPILRKAGVKVRGLHHLRHTFASELLAAGADLLVVSQLLGHSSPTMTLEIYAHALPPRRSQVAAKIDEIFGP